MAVVNPPGVNQFRIMNYGQAVQAGQQIEYNRVRNEAAGMELGEAQDMLRNRKKAQEIRAHFDKMPDQIAELERNKMFDEADKLRDTYIKARKSEVDIIEAMRTGITSDNYKDVRQQMIQSGAITPELWPVEYSDTWFRKERDGKASSLTNFTRKSFKDGAIMSQDIMQRGGNIEWQGEWYHNPDDEPKPEKGTGKEFEFNASDSNAIGGMSVRLHGGTWDPTTGQIRGLDRNLTEKVAAVQAEAERIYATNKGTIPHAVAFAQAARKFGYNLEDKEDTAATDPLHIRKPKPAP